MIALRAVRSKIVGAADRVLDLDEAEFNWDQIKGILISHFKDKRSEQDLIMELTNIRERKLEVEALYTKVMTLKKALNAECETKDVGLLTTIFEPEAGYIVVFNGKNVKLQTDCGVDKTLNGSVLIRFTNCKVLVNNVQYEAEEGLSTMKLGLDIPRIETVKRNRTTQELGIHELRMEDLETKVQISRMQWGTTIHTTTTYTMLGVLTIVIVVVSYFPKKTTIFKPEVTPRPTFTPAIAESAMITAAMPPLWSVVQSEGGGVTASAFTLGGPPPKPPRQPEP
ncbi:GM13217 [Drosophila sechellia]|uniref:GM13217 n=1 Tax=Drosophila sechellia TaxID=7238 RepID=B4IMI0_DROSE|nr:GM13217 [Drosophila sechellia]